MPTKSQWFEFIHEHLELFIVTGMTMFSFGFYWLMPNEFTIGACNMLLGALAMLIKGKVSNGQPR